MALDYDLVFPLRPLLLVDIGIEVVVPSLSTLLADSPQQVLGDGAPVLGSKTVYQGSQFFIFFLALNKWNVTHDPFMPFWLEFLSSSWLD